MSRGPDRPNEHDPGNRDACVVAVEVDGRQRYLFETDKLREMLGASRLMAVMVNEAERLFEEAKGLYLHGPVSGMIHAWAPIEHSKALLEAAWDLRAWLDRTGIPHTATLLVTDRRHFEQQVSGADLRPNLQSVHREIERRLRERKEAKRGIDARPACSLFANCQIHGLEPANRFRPLLPKDEDEPRRELVGYRARAKLEQWKSEMNSHFYYAFLKQPVVDRINRLLPSAEHLTTRDIPRPLSFTDLTSRIEAATWTDQEGRHHRAAGLGDSYIAFACADGDGMGDLLSRIDWNSTWASGPQVPWRRNREFAIDYNNCVDDAFRTAVEKTFIEHLLPDANAARKLAQQIRTRQERIYLPVLPQVLGGDDLWMVIEREQALTFVRHFSEEYALQAGIKPGLKAAAAAATGGGEAALTISLGVAFAKAGYPAHALVEAAESLLKTAKNLSKGKIWGREHDAGQTACIDWHWIRSSRHESMAHAKSKLAYHDGTRTMLLTSLPWAVEDLAHFEEAAKEFQRIARRKREQLETILRLGRPLSDLAWRRWRKSLSPSERKNLDKLMDGPLAKWCSPKGNGQLPWRELEDKRAPSSGQVQGTAMLDLLALQHVLGLQGSAK